MAFTHLPLRRSAGLGFVAAVLGYLPAYVLATVDRAAYLGVTLPAESGDPAPMRTVLEPATATLAGWLWYNAHFVPTSLPTADVGAGLRTLTNVNLIHAVGGVGLLLHLVPPLLLAGAGYAMVRSGSVGAAMALSGGASVAVGYIPLVIVGGFVFTHPVESGVVASPAGIPAVVAAIAYPLVFGGAGGVLAARSE